MARFAVVCAGVMALALAGCAREADQQQSDAPVNQAEAPPPPLTTEMVGGSDPAAQPAVAPAQTPAATAPQGAMTTTPATAPATTPATADTGHAAHADSGHASH